MDTSLKNIIWLGLILVTAGVTYGMMSQKLEERVIRLEVLLEQALAN